MIAKTTLRSGLAGLALAAMSAGLAFAQATTEAPAAAAAAAAVPNKGDTAWMLVSALLVLLMTMPGLALFYGGLTRSKNMPSVMSQVTATAAIIDHLGVLRLQPRSPRAAR